MNADDQTLTVDDVIMPDANVPWRAYEDNGVEWRWPHLAVLKAEVSEGDARRDLLPEVCLWCELRDRDTGALRIQLFRVAFTSELFSDLTPAERTRKLIRETYLKLCAHEVDELLRNTSTWEDPHDAETGLVKETTT